MPTLDDIINSVSNEYDSESNRLLIDKNLREIYIPPSITNIGVESDDDVLRLLFTMPRYYCGIDLNDFNVSVNYLNANAEGDRYEVEDKQADDGSINFSWLVGRTATKYKGTTKFNVCLRLYDTENLSKVVKEFNTTISELPVLEGLETSEYVVQNYADILEQWKRTLETTPGPKGDKGDKGDTGDTGPQGVKGEKGATGDSGVYVGSSKPDDPTVKVWIDPDENPTDITGASAYEVAVEEGFEGTKTEWLASLKGEKGNTGAQGVKGDKGDKGDTGDQGAQGPKGEKGDTGSPGQNGADGITPTVISTPITGGHNVAFSYGSDDPRNVNFNVMDGASGGENPWTLVNEATINEAVSDISITQDSNGQPFAYDELYIEFLLIRPASGSSWNNLRFSFIDANLWDLVMTSQPANLTMMSLRIHVFKMNSKSFVEYFAGQFENTVGSLMRTLGKSVAENDKYVQVKINRANGDLYIQSDSTVKVWGR